MTVKRRKIEKLSCSFCQEKKTIDYKDVETLKPFLTDYGRIVPRYVSGNCAKCQRKLAKAVKLARFMALLPYVGDVHNED